VVFARQANINNGGQQQVNNVAAPAVKKAQEQPAQPAGQAFECLPISRPASALFPTQVAGSTVPSAAQPVGEVAGFEGGLCVQGLGLGQHGAAECSKPAARVRESGLLGYRSETHRRAHSGRPLLLCMFPMAAEALSVGFAWRRISAIDPSAT